MSATPIQHEILRRIHKKIEHSYHRIRSITLGGLIYHQLMEELYHSLFYTSSSLGPSFNGIPIRICYKRKNLIQINLDKPRIRRFVYSHYNNQYEVNPCIEYSYMPPKDCGLHVSYDKARKLSEKTGVSFLTSSQ